MTPSPPLSVDRVEDVTQAHLGGASKYELAAFQGAVMEYMLDAEVPMRTAILVIYDEGDWREIVAERCWLQWTIASLFASAAFLTAVPAASAQVAVQDGLVNVAVGDVTTRASYLASSRKLCRSVGLRSEPFIAMKG